MNKLFTEKELVFSKGSDMLPLKCEWCDKTFYKTSKYIKDIIKGTRHAKGNVCSQECSQNLRFKDSRILFNCNTCGKECVRVKYQFNKSKTHYCSQSCAGIGHNKNKKRGTRRSKLEKYLEGQLAKLYPELLIRYNCKEEIGSELDIFIPSLNLAIEINGIFHYEPIFGIDKLQKIQNNDNNKFLACIEHKIDLCIIDASTLKYWKPANAKKYLDIAVNIIEERLATVL